MRKLLLLPALLISALQVYAGENDPQASVTGTPTVGGLFPHFGLGNPNNATQPGFHRMIAKAYWKVDNGAPAAVDSITYQYSNGRGGIPNSDDVNNDDHVLFDISTTYVYNISASTFENSKQRLQQFNNNRVSELIYKKWLDQSSAWKNAERYRYTYDNTGKMYSSSLEMWYGEQWTNPIDAVLNYDQNNNIVQMNSTTYTIEFTYDQNNNLVMIEDKTRSPGTTWSNNERKKYTYIGDDVSEYILEKWIGGVWANSSRLEYSYDAQHNLVMSTEYTWAGTGWQYVKQDQYFYDSKDNMLKKVEKLWDINQSMFVNSKLEERIYNAGDMLESVTTYSWQSQNWVRAEGDITIRYYYEVYFPTSARQVVANNTLKVYPVPAKDVLYVNMQHDRPTDVVITLTDMTGKLIHQFDSDNTTMTSRAIDVRVLPAGAYTLTVSEDNMKHSRIINVAH